jgi:hypothetical protein
MNLSILVWFQSVQQELHNALLYQLTALQQHYLFLQAFFEFFFFFNQSTQHLQCLLCTPLLIADILLSTVFKDFCNKTT